MNKTLGWPFHLSIKKWRCSTNPPRVFTIDKPLTMLKKRSLTFLVGIFVGSLLSASGTTALAQKSDAEPDLMKLVGQTIEVTFQDFMSEGPYEVIKLTEGKQPGSIQSLRVKLPGGKRNKTIRAKKVAELFVDNRPLDVTYDKKQRGLVFSAEKRANRIQKEKQIDSQLERMGHRVWEPLSDSDQKAFIERQHDFLKKVQEEMPHVPFRLVETEFFMVFTDIEPEMVNGYLENLDAMYRELCSAFGISPQKNVWCGKCVVVIMNRRTDYMVYEARVMGIKDPALLAGSAGLCHMFGNGEVKFAGFLGDNGLFFGNVLIHETTHGFIHRYLSSVDVVSWLNEGMADWVADAIMKDNSIPKRQKQSAQVVMASGGWGNFLTAPRISFQHYGTASTMVDILLARNKDGQFRQFFREIKEGKPVETSLKDTFGLSYKDLETLYVDWVNR
jgi:hypothetical protein